MSAGLLYNLQSVPWDWFGTLTFGMRKIPIDQTHSDLFEGPPKKFRIVGCHVPPVAVRFCMFYKFLRQQEHHWQLKRSQWVLRHEKGELNERPHFHFLMRGLPTGANTSHFRFAAMARWESLGGGMARIRRFDNAQHGGLKSAGEYILKNLGANAYELSKFELEESEVRLSPAYLEFMEERNKRITFKADLENV